MEANLSLLWTARATSLALLFACVGISGFLLKNQKRYETVINNRRFNVLLVTLINVFWVSSVAIPADPGVFPRPSVFSTEPGATLLRTVGLPFMICGVFLIAMTIALRRKRGLKTYEEELAHTLLTQGVYRYFRHPLYAAICLLAVGTPLRLLNHDGVLVSLLVLATVAIGARDEERYDIALKFPEQYEPYRKRTGMFGPRWLWAMVITGLMVLDVLIFLA
jgi:protein-S-isoprenylcysteine O-methyltransferase Ste14